MRSTLELPDNDLDTARRLSGITRVSDLVREGLKALIEREARKRLIAFGASDPNAVPAPRESQEIIAAEDPNP